MSELKQPPQPIRKEYTFSKDELMDLKEIEIAASSFRRAVAGMEVNREFVLQQAYKRIGLEQESDKKDWIRHISYNLAENKIVVLDAPKAEEPKKIKANGEAKKELGFEIR